VVNCSWDSTKPTPGPDDAGGAAGCLEPHAVAIPATPTAVAAAASRPKERRDIPLMRREYPRNAVASIGEVDPD
jgi:hypothetical protein